MSLRLLLKQEFWSSIWKTGNLTINTSGFLDQRYVITSTSLAEVHHNNASMEYNSNRTLSDGTAPNYGNHLSPFEEKSYDSSSTETVANDEHTDFFYQSPKTKKKNSSLGIVYLFAFRYFTSLILVCDQGQYETFF